MAKDALWLSMVLTNTLTNLFKKKGGGEVKNIILFPLVLVVYILDELYFDDLAEKVWEFCIKIEGQKQQHKSI
jgi:hypothetical protein